MKKNKNIKARKCVIKKTKKKRSKIQNGDSTIDANKGSRIIKQDKTKYQLRKAPLIDPNM